MNADVSFPVIVVSGLILLITFAVGKMIAHGAALVHAIGGTICAWNAPAPQVGHATVIAAVAGTPEAPFT
jgi:hypothetical protein